MRGQMSVAGWAWQLTHCDTACVTQSRVGGIRECRVIWPGGAGHADGLSWWAWGTPCLTACCRTSCRVTRTWRRTSAASPYWGDPLSWLNVYKAHTNESAFDILRLFSLKFFRKKTLIEMHSENKQKVFPNLLIFASFSFLLLRILSLSFTLLQVFLENLKD